MTKGIVYLDSILGGRVLRGAEPVYESQLAVVGGRLVREKVRVDRAQAGAYQAFAGFQRPANFAKMSPAEKRRVNQQLAKERRQQRGR